MFVCLFAAAASPTGVEDDLWSDFVQSGQSEVCADIFCSCILLLFSFLLKFSVHSLCHFGCMIWFIAKGITPRKLKLVGGFQNPYPIYDQNLQFFLPCL